MATYSSSRYFDQLRRSEKQMAEYHQRLLDAGFTQTGPDEFQLTTGADFESFRKVLREFQPNLPGERDDVNS